MLPILADTSCTILPYQTTDMISRSRLKLSKLACQAAKVMTYLLEFQVPDKLNSFLETINMDTLIDQTDLESLRQGLCPFLC